MKHILLVEDDLSLLNGLSFALKKQGYALEIARTKDEQKQLWAEDKYELLLGPGAAEHYQIQTGDTLTLPSHPIPAKRTSKCPGSVVLMK